MDEWSESIAPKREPPRPASRLHPMGAGIVGLFVGICSLTFPTYAGLNELATGVFYGLGFWWLLVGVLVLLSARSTPRPPRQLSRAGTLGSTVFFLLVGLGLLTLPKYASVSPLIAGVLYGTGFFMLVLGMLALMSGIFRSRDELVHV